MNDNRVIAYVDGFNLYFGMRDQGWQRYYWLNVPLLCQNLLIANQTLVVTKYFTARVNHPQDKVRRQSTYLEALGTLPDLEITYGRYLSNTYECRNCGYKHIDSKEKMTDINIAVEMIKDTLNDKYDIALLISADSDLVPALRLVKSLQPHKRVVVGFPPTRSSFDLKNIADTSFNIYRTSLAKSILPETVIRADGFLLKKPPTWA